MASADQSLIMREAIVQALAADAALTALVPADRIYGEEAPAMPTWPFLRYSATTLPYEQSGCGVGSEHNFTIHAFARGPGTNAVLRINAAIVDALESVSLDIGSLSLVGIDWQGSRVIRDTTEASAYHGIVEFMAQTLGT